MKRPIKFIAAEISDNWVKPYFGAVPYIQAMHTLNDIDDYYYADSARSTINYFLANAGTWRGEIAKRIKLELKALVK